MDVEETIAAIASPHDAPGLRGIVRISGSGTLAVVRSIFTPTEKKAFDARKPTRISGRLMVRPPIGEISADLMLWPTKRSYTQQPTAELHLLGALPLLNAVLETTCQHGARLARPGEFTLRAFLAGRLDLAQAEAVLGVIDAVDQRELDVALAQLAGGLSEPLHKLRDTLLNLCADVEAGLDFVDEDIEFVTADTVLTTLQNALQTIEATQQKMQTRGLAGQLPRVVLRGEPNVGKSSIWNQLCKNASAIVTNQAGTTRDYLVGKVEDESTNFLLVDTAGIEHDPTSTFPLRRVSDEQQKTAQLVLLCLDTSRELTEWEQSTLEDLPDHYVVIGTKCDIAASTRYSELAEVLVSDRQPETLIRLRGECARRLSAMAPEAATVSSTAARCGESLREAAEALQRGLSICQHRVGDELVAMEIRAALDHLGQVLGAVYTDDILDRVFSRFCIGK